MWTTIPRNAFRKLYDATQHDQSSTFKLGSNHVFFSDKAEYIFYVRVSGATVPTFANEVIITWTGNWNDIKEELLTNWIPINMPLDEFNVRLLCLT